ncbi:MAG: proteasome accessory factor PafA2 family protein [Armatimonadota bacterium]|nr:proteasome accessory factor PafA2 family protein [Armatimonadota bacterium]
MSGIGNRIFGIETEFGCLTTDPDAVGYEEIVERAKDHVFYKMKLGAIDRHPRDEAFEPAYSGGFLINGGRLYVDAVGSHEEYATAECRSFRDLIANDRAGQRILMRALHELDLAESCSFYNNSVDHFGGHTFGCHENYMIRSNDNFLNESVQDIYPFLVTRQIYAGVGRVGGHVIDYAGARPNHRDMTRNPVDYIWVSNIYAVSPDATQRYQLSQRADHIIKAIASRVRFNRALINPKWEAFYGNQNTTRLHLLFGESNQMEYAYALKVGTTCLVLDLAEEGLIPARLRLDDPLVALREVSRDETYQWVVTLETGKTIRSVDLHREYLTLAHTFEGRDEETDWTLREWEATLDALEKDPMSLGDRLDWVAKLKLVEMYREAEGLEWGDDALHSIDLEYHNIDPEKSLYQGIVETQAVKRVISDTEIAAAMSDSPKDTRAYGRSHLVRWLVRRNSPAAYWVDWDAVYLDRQTVVELTDPMNNYKELTDMEFFK